MVKIDDDLNVRTVVVRFLSFGNVNSDSLSVCSACFEIVLNW